MSLVIGKRGEGGKERAGQKHVSRTGQGRMEGWKCTANMQGR